VARKRYTISVRGDTLARLRERVSRVGPAVSDLIDQALDHGEIARDVVARIRAN